MFNVAVWRTHPDDVDVVRNKKKKDVSSMIHGRIWTLKEANSISHN